MRRATSDETKCSLCLRGERTGDDADAAGEMQPRDAPMHRRRPSLSASGALLTTHLDVRAFDARIPRRPTRVPTPRFQRRSDSHRPTPSCHSAAQRTALYFVFCTKRCVALLSDVLSAASRIQSANDAVSVHRGPDQRIVQRATMSDERASTYFRASG